MTQYLTTCNSGHERYTNGCGDCGARAKHMANALYQGHGPDLMAGFEGTPEVADLEEVLVDLLRSHELQDDFLSTCDSGHLHQHVRDSLTMSRETKL